MVSGISSPKTSCSRRWMGVRFGWASNAARWHSSILARYGAHRAGCLLGGDAPISGSSAETGRTIQERSGLRRRAALHVHGRSGSEDETGHHLWRAGALPESFIVDHWEHLAGRRSDHAVGSRPPTTHWWRDWRAD